jgi:hypothetical protein
MVPLLAPRAEYRGLASVLVERVDVGDQDGNLGTVSVPARAEAADDLRAWVATKDELVRDGRTNRMACGECCLWQAKLRGGWS